MVKRSLLDFKKASLNRKKLGCRTLELEINLESVNLFWLNKYL